MLADLILLVAAYVIMRGLATLASVAPTSAKDVLNGFVIVFAFGTVAFAVFIAVVTMTRSEGASERVSKSERTQDAANTANLDAARAACGAIDPTVDSADTAECMYRHRFYASGSEYKAR